MRDRSKSLAVFVADGNGWRQFAITSLAGAEGMIERGTGRIVAVDPDTGVVEAASDAADYGTNFFTGIRPPRAGR